VQARGIELQTSLAYQRRTWQIRQGLAYSYTRSTTEDKQLAYTPFHRLSAWLQVSLQNYFLYQNVSFTGDRYGSLTNTDIMPAFALWNMSVGKDFYFGKQKISLQFRLNNVLNTQYQNYENRAMPRRNYMFSLIFN
jgi:iron complex outermembrane receptor protein